MTEYIWLRPDDDELIELAQKGTGYRFKDADLLRSALTHNSYHHEKPSLGHYQRLEFLGDSVLGLLIAERLIFWCPGEPEGTLSKIKAYLAGETHLAKIFAKTGLTAALHLGRGEDAAGGRDKPALLADACEAILGAIHLEGGAEATKGVADLWFPKEESLQSYRHYGRDFKTELQETVMACWQARPEYQITSLSGPQHAPRFCCTVFIRGVAAGTGQGSSKQLAEKNAAKAALESIQDSKTT